MAAPFTMKIEDIYPSQLYISKKKLAAVQTWIKPDVYDPIPIKKLNGRHIYVDGHTRAYALHVLGVTEINVEWEPEEWDWDAYQICVDWCLDDKIHSIADLTGRLVDHESYEVLWYDRCRKMQNALEKERENI
ncbi:hypothetical protein EZV73_19125 [Acidaminobacter sp. JC074]|uniref:hypothetical protein n=1 Tax=Acidaminobacter sp. JC074 TaxID=2530199 RepID=UPI001F10360F|nr:hypothetical protein [Acidaminobacter sp. JC074]MCH4889703.1 hypothetical protein [Acidaminobacter sp. JC074]